ncbi:MAG TPA: crosslink repair DNA glycosylase YcaQ family protein [Myxococcales bacterium]|nr:crosslink repair DNA glycosylase YcaQ family protein [Myxococcales bacterium]
MSRSNSIRRFTAEQARGLLLLRSGLFKPTKSSVATVCALVQRLGGVRAERLEWAHASLAARLSGYKPDHLEQALLVDKSLLRLWGVRGAELVVHREDAPAQIGAAADEAIQWGRFLDANLSIDGKRRAEILGQMLPGPFSRSDVARRFERHLHLTGKAPPSVVYQKIIREAAAQGRLLWCGGDGNASRYCATSLWLGEELAPQPDLRKLAEIYLAAFPPAPLGDLASCLGTGSAAIKQVLPEIGAVEVDIDGKPAWILEDDVAALRRAPAPENAPAFALPEQDPLVTACPTRDRLGPGLTAAFPSSGETPGTVWIEGKVIATWRREADVAEVRPIGRSTPPPRALAAAFAQGEPVLRPRLVR